MRKFILFALLISTAVVQAQSVLPLNAYDRLYHNNLATLGDSLPSGKWSVSKYSYLVSAFSFYRGGNASILAAPIGLQLNRRLTNNLYAFAGVSVAPTFSNFSRSFVTGGKATPFGNYWQPGLYSRAELGLQYVNDERTFSISGSIGIERGGYQYQSWSPASGRATHPGVTGVR
ncbi:MAG: hypothetical protein ABI151_03115 [Chitinophagaceae bacterium]